MVAGCHRFTCISSISITLARLRPAAPRTPRTVARRDAPAARIDDAIALALARWFTEGCSRRVGRVFDAQQGPKVRRWRDSKTRPTLQNSPGYASEWGAGIE